MEYIDDKEFLECLIRRETVGAIRRYRAVRPCSLQEAKALVDTLAPRGLTEKEEEFLSLWSESYPVYIAGGFLRDNLLGRPVKDIDVYILLSEEEEQRRFTSTYTDYKKLTSEPYKSYPPSFIRNVYQCTVLGYRRLNIITLSPSVNFHIFVEDSFDIGLCKIYYSVNNDSLYTTPEFEKDVRNKTLTVSYYRPDNDHLRRILDKYPKYTVVMKHEQEEEAPF